MIEINELKCGSCLGELTLEFAVEVSGGEEVQCEYCSRKFLYVSEKSSLKGDKIQIGNISGVSGIAIGRGASTTFNQSSQTITGIQINTSGDTITMGGDFSGSNVNVNSWIK